MEEPTVSEQRDYFGSGETVNTTDSGSWFDLQHAIAPFEMAPGLRFRPAAEGNLMVNLVSFEPNVVAPVHAHSEQQAIYVIEGEVEYEVGGEIRTLRPGMAVIIPPHVPHGARTHDSSCLELDIFTPPRQGLLDAMKAQEG
jgi:quercetin dioxygenase-like cupin family protein